MYLSTFLVLHHLCAFGPFVIIVLPEDYKLSSALTNQSVSQFGKAPEIW